MAAKQAPKERIPLWAMISYVIFAALITLIGYRAISIWVGHAFVILFAFPVAGLSKPEFRRVVRFAHAAFALTLLLATLFIQFLNAPGQVEVIESSAILNFLLGGVAARALVSIVLALFISMLLLLMPLFMLAYASSEWLLKMRTDSNITRSQAVRLFLSVIFNTNYFSCIIEDGEITATKPPGILPNLGGPGKVIIKPYNVAIFEKGGEVTRIEGPGKVLTRNGEFVKGTISLRKQWRNFRVENVLTKDNVPLHFECGVGFRIEAAKDTAKRGQAPLSDHQGGKFEGIISGDYKVYKHTLYRAFYDTASKWDATCQGATATRILNIVREYLFEDLYTIQRGRLVKRQSAITEIIEEVIRRTSKLTPNWGAIITGFKITSVEVPETIERELQEMWAAPYGQVRPQLEMRTAKDRIITRGKAEAQAIAAIEKVKSGAREELIDLLQKTLLSGYPGPYSMELISRFLEAIESLTRALSTDTATATRYIEALERMASESGTKILVVGEERQLLPPLLSPAPDASDKQASSHRPSTKP